MAEEEGKVKVFLSGFILSKILGHASKMTDMQDGLLFGKRDCQTVNNITDTHEKDITKEELTVQTIQAARPLRYYNSCGAIKEQEFEKVKRNPLFDNLIGWYRIRRETTSRLSLREKLFIKSVFRSKLYHHDKFLFILVTPSIEENKSTWNFNYKCYLCCEGSAPTSIKCTVINLGEEGMSQHKYKQRSRLLGPGDNITNSFTGVLKDREGSKFFTETGSSVLADSSYSLFTKTLQLMKNIKDDVVSSTQQLDEHKRQYQNLKRSKEKNAARNAK